jgi:hypothetical protein
MEVPDGAKLVDGFWIYQPRVPPLERLNLANSSFTADYRLCVNDGCTDLAEVTETAPTGR